MAAERPITIVGGGMAGLALGIALRRCDLPVTIWEAGHYPRHRVCGEFISGPGQATLTRLGLSELFDRSSAVLARTAAFSSAAVAGRVIALPQPALCVPRYEADAILAARFRELGGDLREGVRWTQAANQEGLVLANGRRLHPVVHGWRWFGLKVHALSVRTEADLELHAFRDGYVGLCRLGRDVVNVCGLFRTRPAPGSGPVGWQDRLRGNPGSPLQDRMREASFLADSFCAVAGIDLTPRRARPVNECRLGDALTMIAPLTGNGMSMALESAELAVQPLRAWSRGELSWRQARDLIASRCDAAYRARLRWATWLQRLAFAPMLQNLMVVLVSRGGWCWQVAFAKTRQAPV